MSFAALACVQHFVCGFFCVCKQKSLACVLLWLVECNSICSYMVPWLNLTFPPEHELDNPRKLSNIISPPGLMDLHLLWYNQQQFTVLPSKLVTQELPATSSKIMLQHDFQAVGLISWQSYFLAVVLKKQNKLNCYKTYKNSGEHALNYDVLFLTSVIPLFYLAVLNKTDLWTFTWPNKTVI